MTTIASPVDVHSSRDSRFACNICLEGVVEPVVTLCGHLYCWPCLYQWLEPTARRTCPVCKSPCSVSSVVPLYIRNEDIQSNKARTTAPLSSSSHPSHESTRCPSTPTNAAADQASLQRRLRFRSIPARPSFSLSQASSSQSNLSPSPPPAGLSTSLALSLQQTLFPTVPVVVSSSSIEDPATEFLSRVLLMLGSFVILCLLLF